LKKIAIIMVIILWYAGLAEAGSGNNAFWGGFWGGMVGQALYPPVVVQQTPNVIVVPQQNTFQPQPPPPPQPLLQQQSIIIGKIIKTEGNTLTVKDLNGIVSWVIVNSTTQNYLGKPIGVSDDVVEIGVLIDRTTCAQYIRFAGETLMQSQSPIDKLKQLKEMANLGLITQEEYEITKQRILKEL